MATRAIRGATTVERDEREQIVNAVTELLTEIFIKNPINKDSIISIFFTATQDIKSVYPAEAARLLGILEAGLLCAQEMYVGGSLEKCIRVLIHAETDIPQKDIKHIYLKGATVLRPDLTDERFAIAIDGPAGAGKSTVAKLLAKELGFIYVDTGAMYRSAALYAIENSVSIEDYIDDISIELKYIGGEQKVFLNGSDVTERIREQDVADMSSKVATLDCVRRAVTDIARNIAIKNDVVMDGRDIGSVVLPNAQVKIYLDASAVIRAKRRVGELKRKGIEADLNEIEKEVTDRDNRDMTRDIAPLKRLPEAIYIDTGNMTAKQAARKIRKTADDVRGRV